MTSHCGRCGSLMLSSITLAVWSKELLQRRWHVTRLPTQHTKAGDSFTTPRLVALTTSREVSTIVELVQYLRPIRIRSFLSRARYDHRYWKIVLGSIAAETRCGSEEARRYISIKGIVSSSSKWVGGRSTSSAAESPPGRHGCLWLRASGETHGGQTLDAEQLGASA